MMNAEKQKEYDNLHAQSREIEEKLRKLRNEDHAEYVNAEKEKFEKLKGKSFYSDSGRSHQGDTVVYLNKILGCDTFQQYGSCNVFQITIYFDKTLEKISRIEFGNNTHRRDSFDGKEKESELTAEKLEELRGKVLLNMNEIFDTFKNTTNEPA